MALSPLTGTATTSAKIGDVNKLIEALNAELAAVSDRLTATVARLDGLESRPDLTTRVEALENEPDPVVPPDLTTRVEALEALVRRSPAENPDPASVAAVDTPGRPAGIAPDQMQLVYDKATIYYGDMELHAQRIAENRWRLYATLNYITVNPTVWTYDEIVEGSAEDVYEHATRRLEELARLKPVHDSVHERVNAMSEGEA